MIEPYSLPIPNEYYACNALILAFNGTFKSRINMYKLYMQCIYYGSLYLHTHISKTTMKHIFWGPNRKRSLIQLLSTLELHWHHAWRRGKHFIANFCLFFSRNIWSIKSVKSPYVLNTSVLVSSFWWIAMKFHVFKECFYQGWYTGKCLGKGDVFPLQDS